jgi:hypothetical protein
MSFVTPILKNGRRSDISNYRGVAILSAIAILFEFLNYRYVSRVCYKSKSTVLNLFEYFSFVLKSIDGCQVNLPYTVLMPEQDVIQC